MSVELRAYQSEAIDRVRASFRRHRRVLLQSPTGSGKTVMFGHIAHSAQAKGTRVCIVAHRRELIRQASDKLSFVGVEHGVISATQRRPIRAQVVVASVQTLARRLDHYQDAFDLLIEDEAHHAVAGQWAKVRAALPKARILGVTATPERLDGRGLGEAFDDLVLGPEIRSLIADGYLSDYDAFTAPGGGPDLTGIRTKMGDFDAVGLASIMERSALVGDAVEHYRQHLAGRPAIAFCVNRRHAEAVAERFRAAGYASEAVDGALDDDVRDRRIGGLADGGLNVLTSCDLISEGLDIPAVAGAILLRPTKSLGLFMQQVGRAFRPKSDGSKAVILDHAGNIHRHGLPCQTREWSLTASKRKKGGAAPVRTCGECFSICFAGSTSCPACGTAFGGEGRAAPDEVAGELIDAKAHWFSADGRPIVERRRPDIDQAVRQCRSWEDLEGLRKSLGFKHGWSARVAESIGWRVIRGAHGFAIKAIPPAGSQELTARDLHSLRFAAA